MTFAERLQRDILEDLTETIKRQHDELKFANDDEERCIDELADLALKLGVMIGKVTNELQSIGATALISYLQNEMSWSAVTNVDMNKDFAKHNNAMKQLFGVDDEDDEDEDEDDDDVGVSIVEVSGEEAREIIEKVLRELREK